jgi:cytochrome oxidase Cu insertion factor (SCO1/SenC/PrrC family)
MMRVFALVALSALLAAGPGRAADDPPHPERLRGVDPADLAYIYGVGRFAPEYEPPAPGSYALPVVDTISDHALLDADGRQTTLFALKRDRLAVVAFVYTTCIEAAGCPLSMAALHQLDREIAGHPSLARQVVLITVSFDPERDTPARMRVVRTFHAPRTDWRFVTTASAAALEPLLLDFDQPVAKLRFPDGEWSGLFRHVLKVFLLDRANQVRNVYSAGFLNPRLVVNDVQTVLRQPLGAGASPEPRQPVNRRASR